MRITKINTFVLFLVCTATFVTRADVSIQWNADSYSAFDVTISGTGSWQGTITSPSGLWQLSAQNFLGYDPGGDGQYPGPLANIENLGVMTFLGQIPSNLDSTPSPFDNVLETKPYSDFLPLSVPIHDGNTWYSDPFGGPFLVRLGWGGYLPITITSLPVINDSSTWTWVSEYYASGPTLAPVPEPGTVSLGLISVLLLAARTIRGRA